MLYNIIIYLMSFGLRVLSCFNEKAAKGVQGRKRSFLEVEKLKGERVIWMHAASLGEYEQGFPVLEKLKEKYPNHKILVTFFSPSGYENVVKKFHIADVVCYLPWDKKIEIRDFISQFRTDIFFTIKYDFWYHLLRELHHQGAKIFVVSALFYERQIFFKPYGKWFVKKLGENVDWFFNQNEHSDRLAKSIGLVKSSVSGDTRFDRVKQIKERDNSVAFIEEFRDEKPLVIFGSSWEAEEKIAEIITEKSSNIKIIIAPHDLKRIPNSPILSKAKKYSEINENECNIEYLKNENILVIDSIGLLSKLYFYADIAVVGGGFHSAGLHNILEAATFGKPVIFGNHYRKNPEADSLIAHNGGKSFAEPKDAADFVLNLIGNSKLLVQMSKNSADFIHQQPNATEVILKKIFEKK